MTYGILIHECRGYCSGWQSFRLDLRPIRGKLQPLKGPLHLFSSWVDIALRNRDAAVPRNPHDRERVHSRFSESSKHCMARGVENEIGGRNRLTKLDEDRLKPRRFFEHELFQWLKTRAE